MTHHHFVPRKTVRPRDSSRDPSPDHVHVHDEHADVDVKQMQESVTPVESIES